LWFDVQQLAETLHRSSVLQIASDPIDSIGRINDNISFLQGFHYPRNLARLRSNGVNAKQFGWHTVILTGKYSAKYFNSKGNKGCRLNFVILPFIFLKNYG
jgi:hypothetical protein